MVLDGNLRIGVRSLRVRSSLGGFGSSSNGVAHHEQGAPRTRTPVALAKDFDLPSQSVQTPDGHQPPRDTSDGPEEEQPAILAAPGDHGHGADAPVDPEHDGGETEDEKVHGHPIGGGAAAAWGGHGEGELHDALVDAGGKFHLRAAGGGWVALELGKEVAGEADAEEAGD